MKAIGQATVLFLFLVTLLAACNDFATPLRTKSTEVMETAMAEARTSVVGTQLAIFSDAQTATLLPPSITPTQTSTPVPPLTSHEWIPNTVLITFGNTGGDGGSRYKMSIPNDLILFSNGDIFISTWDYKLSIVKIRSATLSRQETCNLLNSIDQAGFFDYDPSIYEKESHGVVFGAEVTQVSVQAWRSNSVNLYALDYFINHEEENKEHAQCGDCPNLLPPILPSIRKTYQLLSNYKPENLATYQSDRLGVWVDAFTDNDSSTEWSIKSVKLSNIVSADGYSDNEPNIILSGEKAKAVYKLFDQTVYPNGLNFKEGDKIYQVFARPLLPNEYISNFTMPTDMLSCTPSDGWVTIP